MSTKPRPGARALTPEARRRRAIAILTQAQAIIDYPVPPTMRAPIQTTILPRRSI